MPYIRIDVTEKVDDQLKGILCMNIADMITVLPGKKISRTMVEIQDGCFILYDGSLQKAAKVRVELYKESPFEAKAELTKQISALLQEKLAIPMERIYVTFPEYESWGSGGTLK